jgi:argininosuccinate lyase
MPSGCDGWPRNGWEKANDGNGWDGMTLWSGRFSSAPSDVLWEYTVGREDRRLLGFDVEGSIAHVGMLAKVGLLDRTEFERIEAGLATIRADAADGTFVFLDSDEDVHSAVERRLVELVGEVGKKLHTGRSRNDQIALDLRLYLRQACRLQADRLGRFGLALLDQAARHDRTIVPSYTHLQQAQAVPLGHHLLAYAWMAVRDRQRFLDLAHRVGVSPLGAGASGGSSLPIDPIASATALGFEVVFANSMDAVGSRDLAAEFTWCCAQTMVDLSRLAEELVLWSTTEFGWVSFSDSFTTGSSALPQKKNPDIAELARGKAAGSIADVVAMLTLQKGLPLTYNRDLQEDKVHVFRADDTLAGTLEALTALIDDAEFRPPPPSSWVSALDLAEALVMRGVPFRSAHEAVGRLVARLVGDGRVLADATVEDLAGADEAFQASDLDLIDPVWSVEHRVSMGGGSVSSVHDQIAALRYALTTGT